MNVGKIETEMKGGDETMEKDPSRRIVRNHRGNNS